MAAFNNAGNMFALAMREVIDIYCAVLFEKRASCYGHMAIVSVVWGKVRIHHIAWGLRIRTGVDPIREITQRLLLFGLISVVRFNFCCSV